MALEVGIQDGNDGEGAASSKKALFVRRSKKVLRWPSRSASRKAVLAPARAPAKKASRAAVTAAAVRQVDIQESGDGETEDAIEGGDDGAVRQTLQNGATTACEVGV